MPKQLSNPFEPRTYARVCVALGVTFTVGLVFYAWRLSDFVGDDLSAFWLIQTIPFHRYMTTPLGGQLVVLHRMTTWLLYRTAPMNFAVAAGCQGCLQLIGATFLYRTLEVLKPSRVNAVLVGYYLMGMLAGLQFMWWSSGLTRLAYIALALIAIRHHLSFVSTRRHRDFWIVALCSVGSLGFYSKGLLIPVYCAGAQSLYGKQKNDHRRAASLGLLGLLGVGILYVVVVRSRLPPEIVGIHIAPRFLGSFLVDCWGVLASTFVSVAATPGSVVGPVAVAVALISCVASIAFVRATAAPLAVFVGTVTLNFLFMGVSSRTLMFGESVAYQYRHYFELWFVAVLFVGVAFHRIETALNVQGVRAYRGLPPPGNARIARPSRRAFGARPRRATH